ncbi:MAG: cytochrome c3 family protein, partial [Deltaproteobacteria bacterium]|nr:cytochrome c3 family protein [Deltaproteobacteria bacterium]
ALTLSHQTHANDCATCHRGSAAAPHTRCLACHRARASADATPPITACTTCHAPVYGPAAGPSLTGGELRLRGFDHARHRAAEPTAACTSCHAAIARTEGIALPTPTSASCATAGCHDGAAAFATTIACTRCHTRAAAPSYRAARPTARYSHASHAARQAAACAACHRLDAQGEAPAPDHAACVGCHADDFASAAPRICGACHVATEPWRHLIADRPPAAITEFGARLSHATHAQPCARCHVAAPSGELATARGHAACAGACHAATSGPAPRLDDCAGCHALGLAGDREADRRGAPWSVRARFRHGPHLRGTPAPACTACHGGVDRATSIAAIPTPKKPACAPCHDGAVAFKLTGTSCVRCHGPRDESAP